MRFPANYELIDRRWNGRPMVTVDEDCIREQARTIPIADYLRKPGFAGAVRAAGKRALDELLSAASEAEPNDRKRIRGVTRRQVKALVATILEGARDD